MYLLKEYTIYISELFYKWGKLVVFAIIFLNWWIIADSKDIRDFSGNWQGQNCKPKNCLSGPYC